MPQKWTTREIEDAQLAQVKMLAEDGVSVSKIAKLSACHARRLIALLARPKQANPKMAAMVASNSPSIRELALAALARQRGGGWRETAVRQGVSSAHPASHPRETPFANSNQSLNPGVSPSHAIGVRQVRQCENCETPRETAVRQSSGFPFAEPLDRLGRQCPDHVDPARWRQCIADASRFASSWGDKAAALGWTGEDLFGLHEPPAKPGPTYRLSRYDTTGLLWLLHGRPVIALTDTTAAIGKLSGGTVIYRKDRDSLDDLGARS
jgi:hypothetical protein